MASKDLVSGLARLLLQPDKLDLTEKLVEADHNERVDEKDYEGALLASEVLSAIRKMKQRRDRPAKPAPAASSK